MLKKLDDKYGIEVEFVDDVPGMEFSKLAVAHAIGHFNSVFHRRPNILIVSLPIGLRTGVFADVEKSLAQSVVHTFSDCLKGFVVDPNLPPNAWYVVDVLQPYDRTSVMWED